jgi:lipopolysaccharide export system protein LptA
MPTDACVSAVRRPLALWILLALGLGPGLAGAEKADRSLPMEVLSDGKQAATVDLARKVTVVNGHVTITQGTLLIKADRVEVREIEPGRFTASARGAGDQPASFRQKRDRVDEFVDGEADRLDYDGAAEKVHFIGNARLRVLRGGVPTDEASASTIVYDQRADTIVFEGGGKATPGVAAGRARLVFVPRTEPSASGAAASTPAAPPSGGAR